MCGVKLGRAPPRRNVFSRRAGPGCAHRAAKLFLPMETAAAIQCPFCGQTFELLIDTSGGSQRFTTDCEICCRPFEVTVECSAGEILSVDVAA